MAGTPTHAEDYYRYGDECCDSKASLLHFIVLFLLGGITVLIVGAVQFKHEAGLWDLRYHFMFVGALLLTVGIVLLIVKCLWFRIPIPIMDLIEEEDEEDNKDPENENNKHTKILTANNSSYSLARERDRITVVDGGGATALNGGNLGVPASPMHGSNANSKRNSVELRVTQTVVGGSSNSISSPNAVSAARLNNSRPNSVNENVR